MKPALKQLLFSRGIVKNGLVLWLEGEDFFNSPQTTTWGDRSGNRNNATPGGMAYTTSSGSDGMGGVVFDGVNDYISETTKSSLSFLNNPSLSPFTILMRVYLISGSYIFSSGAQSTDVKGIYISYGDGDPVFEVGTAVNDWTINTAMLLSQWVTYGLTFDGITLKIFENGILKARTTYTSSNIRTNEYKNFSISCPNNALGEFATRETIKNFVIYNRALTDSEIRQNYNALR